MPTSINSNDTRSFFQRGTDLIIGKISPSKTISQVELISNLETKAPITKPLSIEERREKTNAATQEFVIKSTIFAIGSFLYKWCNVGDKDTDVDRKLLYIVRDLSKCKSPGFREIRTVMKRYFKNLSFFRMAFFYCTFVSWVPKLYISTTVNKLLDTSRKKLNDGKNLPDLGSRVVKTANSYLANYNNAVDRFRDDETNPTGDRDKYVKEHLQHPKILGFDSVEVLNSEFAKAASKEGMRPGVNYLSKIVKKIQLLEFKILSKIPKVLLLPLKAATFTLGAIPYILAKLLEIPPNVIINIFHKSMIKSYGPSILEDSLKAVNRSGFTHAINCFLSDIIEDALIEMKKGPYEKTTEEPPKYVDKALSSDIKKFSEFLFTLITREQYQTKDELKRIQKNGLVPKSGIERFLKK
nr:hypothetical protein [Candidatus Anoxychlamydiales bacterium]